MTAQGIVHWPHVPGFRASPEATLLKQQALFLPGLVWLVSLHRLACWLLLKRIGSWEVAPLLCLVGLISEGLEGCLWGRSRMSKGTIRPVFISSRLQNILLFELSQLICVFTSPKFIGIFGQDNHPKISWASLKKYPGIFLVRLHQPTDSHYARTLSKISRANFSSLSFKFIGQVSSWWRCDL